MKRTLLAIILFFILSFAAISVLSACNNGGGTPPDCDATGEHTDSDGDKSCDFCGRPLCTVSFTYPDGTVKTYMVGYGAYFTAEIPDDPTVPEGYEFKGWYEEDGKRDLDVKREITSDYAYTARIKPKTWQITYVNCQRGSNPTTYKTGETVEIKPYAWDVYEHSAYFFDPECTRPATVISGMMEDISLYSNLTYLPFRSITEPTPGSIVLSDYSSYSVLNKLEIPETFHGKTVVGIDFGETGYEIGTLIIPKTVTSLERLPRYVGEILVSAENEAYKSADGSLYSKDGTVLYKLCTDHNDVICTVPEGVTRIENKALAYSNVLSITFPTTLTEMNERNYSGYLYEIYNLSEHLTFTKGSSEHYGIARIATVHTSKEEPSVFSTVDGFIFLKNADKNYLVRYVGGESVITSPAAFEGGTYQLFESAFGGASLKEITLSAAVTSVGTRAFAKCGALEKLTVMGGATVFEGHFMFPSTLKSICVPDIQTWLALDFVTENPLSTSGARLYVGGELLTDLTVPAGVTAIKDNAFSQYKYLGSVTLSETVKSVGKSAFYKSSVSSFTASAGLESIAYSAFSGCEKLESVNLHSGVKSIASAAFANCTALDSFTLPAGLEYLHTETFKNCTFLAEESGMTYLGNWLLGISKSCGETVVIKDGTVGIASQASSASSVIKSLTVPESVKYICSRAFSASYLLETINYNAIEAVFPGHPDSGTTYDAPFDDRTGKDAPNGLTLYIGANVKIIPAYMFYGEYDSSYVYSYSPYIKSIVYSGSALKEIGDYAFGNVTTLERITVPASVTRIGAFAFYKCNSATEITVPKNVQSIGLHAFGSCTGVKNIYYNAENADDIMSDYNLPFATGADGYTLTVGSTVKRIPASMFRSSGVSQIVFEGSSACSSIGNYAFYYNYRLQSVTLPESVETLDAYSFGYCTELESITGEGLAYVSENALIGSNKMPSNFGERVYGNINYRFKTPLSPVNKQITWAAFLPGSSVPDNFFRDCLNLTHVYVPADCTLGAGVFSISSYSDLAKRLTLRVLTENTSFETVSGWRDIISYGGTDYALSMVVSVGGQNVTLGSLTSGVKLAENGLAYMPDRSDSTAAVIMGYFGAAADITVSSVIDGYTAYKIDDSAFYAHNGLGRVTVKGADIGALAFAASSVTHLTLSDASDIGDMAFYGCKSLVSVSLGEIEEIGISAFEECTLLSEVEILESAEHNLYIRDRAFFGCASLETLVIPDNIYTVGADALSGSGITQLYCGCTDWTLIAGAASGSPSVMGSYTVSTPEAFADAMTGTYASYYWANSAALNG